MWTADTHAAVVRAARWHDVGKVHDVFQSTMRRGLGDRENESDLPLAKTVKQSRHKRPFFRHELASALALLAHEEWSRDADLIAYLVAAHHGKVRMNLRALPRERAPSDSDRVGARFARGIWEADELRPVNLGNGRAVGGWPPDTLGDGTWLGQNHTGELDGAHARSAGSVRSVPPRLDGSHRTTRRLAGLRQGTGHCYGDV